MKKIGIITIVAFVLTAIGFMIYEYHEKQVLAPIEITVPELAAYRTLQSMPIQLTDVATTQELADLFKGAKYDEMPRIFVRRFPDDFAAQGNVELQAAVLLPHVLYQNELLGAERAAFLALSDKLKRDEALTPSEEAFWAELLNKYEVLNPDRDGQEQALFERQGLISPALAIAQSLEATAYGKKHLDSPFDVRRWNDKKEYDYVVYPDLASAVQDYALELNRGYAYANMHMIRVANKSLVNPPPGRFLASGLALYKIEDELYTKKLEEIFKWFKFGRFDYSAFAKDKGV